MLSELQTRWYDILIILLWSQFEINMTQLVWFPNKRPSGLRGLSEPKKGIIYSSHNLYIAAKKESFCWFLILNLTKRESESDGKENLFIHLASAQTAVCLWLLYIINSDFKGGGDGCGGGRKSCELKWFLSLSCFPLVGEGGEVVQGHEGPRC